MAPHAASVFGKSAMKALVFLLVLPVLIGFASEMVFRDAKRASFAAVAALPPPEPPQAPIVHARARMHPTRHARPRKVLVLADMASTSWRS